MRRFAQTRVPETGTNPRDPVLAAVMRATVSRAQMAMGSILGNDEFYNHAINQTANGRYQIAGGYTARGVIGQGGPSVDMSTDRVIRDSAAKSMETGRKLLVLAHAMASRGDPEGAARMRARGNAALQHGQTAIMVQGGAVPDTEHAIWSRIKDLRTARAAAAGGQPLPGAALNPEDTNAMAAAELRFSSIDASVTALTRMVEPADLSAGMHDLMSKMRYLDWSNASMVSRMRNRIESLRDTYVNPTPAVRDLVRQRMTEVLDYMQRAVLTYSKPTAQGDAEARLVPGAPTTGYGVEGGAEEMVVEAPGAVQTASDDPPEQPTGALNSMSNIEIQATRLDPFADTHLLADPEDFAFRNSQRTLAGRLGAAQTAMVTGRPTVSQDFQTRDIYADNQLAANISGSDYIMASTERFPPAARVADGNTGIANAGGMGASGVAGRAVFDTQNATVYDTTSFSYSGTSGGTHVGPVRSSVAQAPAQFGLQGATRTATAMASGPASAENIASVAGIAGRAVVAARYAAKASTSTPVPSAITQPGVSSSQAVALPDRGLVVNSAGIDAARVKDGTRMDFNPPPNALRDIRADVVAEAAAATSTQRAAIAKSRSALQVPMRVQSDPDATAVETDAPEGREGPQIGYKFKGATKGRPADRLADRRAVARTVAGQPGVGQSNPSVTWALESGMNAEASIPVTNADQAMEADARAAEGRQDMERAAQVATAAIEAVVPALPTAELPPVPPPDAAAPAAAPTPADASAPPPPDASAAPPAAAPPDAAPAAATPPAAAVALPGSEYVLGSFTGTTPTKVELQAVHTLFTSLETDVMDRLKAGGIANASTAASLNARKAMMTWTLTNGPLAQMRVRNTPAYSPRIVRAAANKFYLISQKPADTRTVPSAATAWNFNHVLPAAVAQSTAEMNASSAALIATFFPPSDPAGAQPDIPQDLTATENAARDMPVGSTIGSGVVKKRAREDADTTGDREVTSLFLETLSGANLEKAIKCGASLTVDKRFKRNGRFVIAAQRKVERARRAGDRKGEFSHLVTNKDVLACCDI